MFEVLWFTAPWCGPCRAMTPFMEQLIGEGHNIRKINVDDNRQMAQEFRIGGVPTLVITKDGTEVTRAVGARDKDSLVRLLQSVY